MFQVSSTQLGLCPVGTIPFYKALGLDGHNGEDWKTWNGEPLYFPVKADTEWWTRSEIDTEGGIGLDVFSSKRIHLDKLPEQAGRLARREWEENDHKVYIKIRFWHLKKVDIPDARRPTPEDPRKAPNVVFGQKLGTCDSTGASSGHHLHWSMKIVAKNSMTLDNDNGYTGAVDFSDWFDNKFALDTLSVKPEPLSAYAALKKLILFLENWRDSLRAEIDTKLRSKQSIGSGR